MIKKATKKFKMVYGGDCAYKPGHNSWSFVKKVKGGFETLGSPMGCKDYIHEAIANKIHGKEIFMSAGSGPVSLEKFQIAMFFRNTHDNFKANLYSVKKYINTLEKAAGIKQTLIAEADALHEEYRAFILTCSKAYVESPGLHHALVAMMRTLHSAEKNVTKNNIQDIVADLTVKDYNVLRFMLKHKVYDLLLQNHKKIKALDLKDVYPEGVDNRDGYEEVVNSYHGGFGMVAICRRKIASKAYSKVVCKILEDAKVPKYSQ